MKYQNRNMKKTDITSKVLEAIHGCDHGDYHLPDSLEGFDKLWEYTPEKFKHSREGRKWISRPEAEELELQISEDLKRIGEENICITTGGPGSGKSTMLVKDYIECPGKVMAPSGVAAQRLRNDLQAYCYERGITPPIPTTIHHAMQIPVKGAPKWTSSNGGSKGKKRADAYYIDEASMIDTKLFATLLKRIKKGARVYLYGDPDQLPPVGWGSPLLSLAGRVGKHRHLKGNHRAKGVLSDAIEKIQKGEWPEESPVWTEEVVSGDFGVGCRRAAMRAYTNKSQILTPWRASAQLSGRVLASMTRPKSKADYTSFLPGDEIVACHSMHQASVTNGVRYVFKGKTAHGGWRLQDMDSGITFSVGASLIKKASEYSIDKIKDPAEWETSSCFLFAGGLTVHKSQGSQYNNVVLLIHDTDNLEFYSKALAYVAASRAKESVHIVWCAEPERVPELKKALLTSGHDYMSNIPELLGFKEGTKDFKMETKDKLKEFLKKNKKS